MKTAKDFVELMSRVRDTRNELKMPPLNPTITNEDIINILDEICGFFGAYSYVVDGRDIDLIQDKIESTISIINDIKVNSTESAAQKDAKKALKNLNDVLDPYLENLGVNN